MMKKNADTDPVYVDIDENTGQEIHRKKPRKPRVHLKKDPCIEPKTDLQKSLLAIYERAAFAHQAEYSAFHAMETKFKKDQELEYAVWQEWILRMIDWAKATNARQGKQVIDVYKVCSAINNKESWGMYWKGNKTRVQRAMKNEQKLEESHENKVETW